jgi:hypothetical protein
LIHLTRRRNIGWIQRRAALAAKFAAHGIGRTAGIAELANRMTALSAKFCVNRYLGPAMGAFHNHTFNTLRGTDFDCSIDLVI